ncbi:hypothetical protein TRFO_28659 [Tritrichomonas foetus]|uniref:EGF-like domain-containing protein n=1 Tax=Tritrichomonas foetus TaxID=1144522 RepID=A0A1J4JZ25_9EUKA|nr:hypothetical protein TRFO_28659 [Tritrichomonas foetus]|eukprot:OHT03946.1 hypothetical protein TRFO_28659 [Tritrichomonas foetus]
MLLVFLLAYFDVHGLVNSYQNDVTFATMRGNKKINFNSDKFIFQGLDQMKMMKTNEQSDQTKEEKDFREGNEDTARREWCYVKFNESLKNKEKQEILSKIKLKADSINLLTKSVYQLYLTQKQIDYLLDNNILIHSFKPEDKISIKSLSFKKSNRNFHKEHYQYSIMVHETFTIPTNENLYKILSRSSKTSYIVSIQFEKIKEAISYLSELSGVSLISDYIENKINNHFASGFVQKNEQKISENSSYIPRYLNEKGITGKNEVVTIIDDLIDIHHSHFYDEKANITFNTYLPYHRKIVYYKFNGTHSDFQEKLELDSHGTHVAGTVAGNNVCTDEKLKLYDGNAPDAKLAYSGGLNDPTIFSDLIVTMNLTNSKISTNSWSTNENYPIQSYIINMLSVENPDKLFIFAAGNDGNKCPISSVKDPSSSKNAITIGSLNSLYIEETKELYSIQVLEDTNQNSKTDSMKSIISPIKDFIGNFSQFIIVDGESAADICHFFKKERDIILSGANETELENRVIKCLTKDKNISFRSIFIANKSSITPFINKNVKIQHQGEVNSSLYYSKAGYSSTGPTIKGILKPDVMTPGTKITSAKALSKNLKDHGFSDNDYIFMDGTSMATPNAAGAAALIRQYFVEGNWLNKKISLSSIQLRGLMISSSSNFNMQDVSDKQRIINYRTGFGAVDLSTILSFNNTEFGVAMTKTEGNKIESNSHYRTKIRIEKSKYSMKRLSFVLSYLDLETNYDSIIPLLNDLDLVVISPSGKKYLGNDNNYKKQDLTNKTASYLSTNERVLLSNEEIEDGEYTIDIYSNELFNEESIEFSLIVAGPVDNQYLEFKPTKECDCHGSQKCSDSGHCKCDKNHIGNHCQIEITSIKNPANKKFNIAVGASEIKYFYLDAGKIGTIYTKNQHNASEYTSIWVGKECSQQLGSYDANGFIKEGAITVGLDSPVCIALFNNYPMQQTFQFEISKINWVLALQISLIVFLVVFIIVVILSIWCCCHFCKCCASCCPCCSCCQQKQPEFSELTEPLTSCQQFGVENRH